MYQDCTKFMRGYINKRVLIGLLLCLIGILIYAYMSFSSIAHQKIKPIEKQKVAFLAENKQYHQLSASVTTQPIIQAFIARDPKKIQVIEFFNYGCYWCSRLHPLVNRWLTKKPANVVFYRFPIVFHKSWEPLAKAYYVVKLLGKSKELDTEFFNAIFQKHLNLSDEKLLKVFFLQHGVPEKTFLDLYNSFLVNNEATQGNNLSNAYQIVHSPSLVVNGLSGSYVLTSETAGGEEAIFKALDALLAKESLLISSDVPKTAPEGR